VDYNGLILVFTSIIYEALPFVVLGVILAGLLEEFVPQQFIARIVPRSAAAHVGAIALGGVLGLIFPMCECGIIPVMRRLLRKGVPLSVCICYLLAGPIINPIVLTSTGVAFTADIDSKTGEVGAGLLGPAGAIGLRAGMAFIVAFVTALVVDRLYARHGNALLTPLAAHDATRHEDATDARSEKRTWRQSASNVTETALHDFVDIMAFLVLGAMIAAVARVLLPGLGAEGALRQAPILAIPLMMVFAFVFCLCSEADAFVAVNFQPIELWPPASKIAFLVLGPMLDIKLVLMYTRVFRRKLILTIIACVVVQVLLYSVALHLSLGGEVIATPPAQPAAKAAQ
jgi:uncharacterized membrane protein YraQ (UPF0718 family)